MLDFTYTREPEDIQFLLWVQQSAPKFSRCTEPELSFFVSLKPIALHYVNDDVPFECMNMAGVTVFEHANCIVRCATGRLACANVVNV